MKRRTGILGGTFNPVHTGHLIMAQDAMESYELNRVLFVPCAMPPHKGSASVAPSSHRIAMLQAAIEGSPCFEVCDIELLRGGTSYTVDTVTELSKTYQGEELFFITGSDSLFELHTWKNIYELLGLCRIITAARPGFDPEKTGLEEIQIKEPWREKLLADVFNLHQVNISSSDIRHRIAEGLSITYLVPQSVEMYIIEHKLYCAC